MNEPSLDEYLSDFNHRCHAVIVSGGSLLKVKEAILRKECPFIEAGFERDAEFRRMRRYYRKTIQNGLMDDLLRVIGEVEK